MESVMVMISKTILASGVALAGAISGTATAQETCENETKILTRVVVDNGEVLAYPNIIATHKFCDGGTLQVAAKVDSPRGHLDADSMRLFSASYSNTLSSDISYEVGELLPFKLNNGDFGIVKGMPLGNTDLMQLDGGLMGGYIQKNWDAATLKITGRLGAFIRPVDTLNNLGWQLQ